jgi:hypothetical protein
MAVRSAFTKYGAMEKGVEVFKGDRRGMALVNRV